MSQTFTINLILLYSTNIMSWLILYDNIRIRYDTNAAGILCLLYISLRM